MAGIFTVTDGNFADTTLTRVNLNPVPVIAGATFDYAADNLAPGSITSWLDEVSGLSLPATGGSPTVTTEAGQNFIRFDGVDDIMSMPYAHGSAYTLAFVARINNVAFNNYVADGTGHYLATNSGLTQWTYFAGATSGVVAPVNSAWHVFVVSANGASSALRVDTAEATGQNVGTNTPSTIRLGKGYGTTFTKLDIKRAVYLPYAAAAPERANIQAALAARYGI